MKNFTVWFRVGKDFKETIEAEDVHDAERKWGDKMAEQFHLYVKDLADDPEAVIYDIAEAGEDLDTYRAVERFEEVIDENS
jgi:hypothetical protein